MPNPELMTCTSPLITEAIAWLQEKQPKFTAALADFGDKLGIGFEQARPEHIGEYTGAGLCSFAAGIEEEAIRRKYGDLIGVVSNRLYAKRQDPSTYSDEKIVEENVIHFIILLQASGSEERISDPTYRQLNIAVDPSRMLNDIPYSCLEVYYTAGEAFKQEKKRRSGRLLQPRRMGRGELFRGIIEDIDMGQYSWLKAIKSDDYRELLTVFS